MGASGHRGGQGELEGSEQEDRRVVRAQEPRRACGADRETEQVEREDRREGIHHASQRDREDAGPRDLVEDRGETGGGEERDDEPPDERWDSAGGRGSMARRRVAGAREVPGRGGFFGGG